MLQFMMALCHFYILKRDKRDIFDNFQAQLLCFADSMVADSLVSLS